MPTTLEQRKSWAFIGTLAFISIAVNATYAHVQQQYRYRSLSADQPSHSTPAIAASIESRAENAPTPQAIPASYSPPADSVPLFIPSEGPSSEFQIISKSKQPHLTEAERLLRKEERKEAREEAATNSPLAVNTNAAATHKDTKHVALSPKEKDHVAVPQIARHEADQRSDNPAPPITHEQGKNSEHFSGSTMKKAVEVKIATAAKEADLTSAPKPAEKEPATSNVQTLPSKEVKTASSISPPLSGDEADKARSDAKIPPNAPSPAVMKRISKRPAPGEQPQNQNPSHDSKQQHDGSQNQSSQPRQQNQQNRNNGNSGNNAGGNGSGGGRRH